MQNAKCETAKSVFSASECAIRLKPLDVLIFIEQSARAYLPKVKPKLCFKIEVVGDKLKLFLQSYRLRLVLKVSEKTVNSRCFVCKFHAGEVDF